MAPSAQKNCHLVLNAASSPKCRALHPNACSTYSSTFIRWAGSHANPFLSHSLPLPPFSLCCRRPGRARVASKTVPGSARRHTVALFPPQIAHTHVHPPTHPMHTRGSGRVVRVGLLRCLSIGQVVARPGRSLGHRRRCEQYTSPRNARASADFMGYST